MRRGRPPTTGRQEMLSATLELLRERGVAKLTTREVARRAGVSEGSIFYHFGDRQGLLMAVFTDALQPLWEFKNETGLPVPTTVDDVRNVLRGFTAAVRTFLDAGLDVLLAAQGDAELRTEVGRFMVDNDYGPHRGSSAISAYLSAAQAEGIIRQDVDAEAVSYLLVSETFMRCTQPKLISHERGVPDADRVLDTLMAYIAPNG